MKVSRDNSRFAKRLQCLQRQSNAPEVEFMLSEEIHASNMRHRPQLCHKLLLEIALNWQIFQSDLYFLILNGYEEIQHNLP